MQLHRARWLTGFVPAVVAVTAIAGGSLLVARPDGALLGIPTSALAHSPFATFLVPGLVLAIVVGGVNAIAAGMAIAGARRADTWAILAGVVLFGWVVAEMVMLRTVVLLQLGYLFAALAIIVVAARCRAFDARVGAAHAARGR